jgi:hypothetical protein
MTCTLSLHEQNLVLNDCVRLRNRQQFLEGGPWSTRSPSSSTSSALHVCEKRQGSVVQSDSEHVAGAVTSRLTSLELFSLASLHPVAGFELFRSFGSFVLTFVIMIHRGRCTKQDETKLILMYCAKPKLLATGSSRRPVDSIFGTQHTTASLRAQIC